jgi:predicted GIY-YIG superfamily endonuclease
MTAARWRGAKVTYENWQYVVYRAYDADGRLIYIGSTRDVVSRFAQHEMQSWWHELVADVTTVEYPTREAVRAAEIVAIQEEQPAFNTAHTTNGAVLTEADVQVARRARREGRTHHFTLGVLDAISLAKEAS